MKIVTHWRKEHCTIHISSIPHALLSTPCRCDGALILTLRIPLVDEHTDLQRGAGFGKCVSKLWDQYLSKCVEEEWHSYFGISEPLVLNISLHWMLLQVYDFTLVFGGLHF